MVPCPCMPKKVLIVDDAVFMRNMIRDIFTGAGFEVVGEAANGLEAVEKFRELRPDLTTMDIVMPFKSGIEATREIVKVDPRAVVEMAPLLGLPGRAPGDGGGQVLVLDRERRALGFLVDEVLGVEPVDLPDRSGERLPVKGLSTVRGSPVAVLDPDALAAAAQRLFRGPAA